MAKTKNPNPKGKGKKQTKPTQDEPEEKKPTKKPKPAPKRKEATYTMTIEPAGCDVKKTAKMVDIFRHSAEQAADSRVCKKLRLGSKTSPGAVASPKPETKKDKGKDVADKNTQVSEETTSCCSKKFMPLATLLASVTGHKRQERYDELTALFSCWEQAEVQKLVEEVKAHPEVPAYIKQLEEKGQAGDTWQFSGGGPDDDAWEDAKEFILSWQDTVEANGAAIHDAESEGPEEEEDEGRLFFSSKEDVNVTVTVNVKIKNNNNRNNNN